MTVRVTTKTTRISEPVPVQAGQGESGSGDLVEDPSTDDACCYFTHLEA